MIYFDLIFNLSLLVALSVFSGFIDNRWPRYTMKGVLMQGALFGGASIIGMLYPVNLGPDLIFDGRSVMVSICALFFGPWAASVAGVMAIACRIALGGAGTITGVLVVLSSAGIGLVVYFRLKPTTAPPSAWNLYIFGLAVHLAMMALMLTLPGNAGMSVVKRIGLPVLFLYPLATILIGRLLSDQAMTLWNVEALKKSEKLFQVVFESANVGKSITLPTGEINVNQALCDMLGYTREELKGRKWQDITPPDELAVTQKPFDELLQGKQDAVRFKKKYIHKNGSYIWADLSVVAHRDIDRKPLYLITTIIDITEQRKSEEALRRTRDLLNETQHISKVGGWEYDQVTKRVIWTDEVYRIYGVSRDYDLSRPENDMQFYAPEDRKNIEDAFRRAVETGEPYDLELRFINAQGERLWVRTIGQVERKEDKIIRVFGNIMDITDHKRAEEALRESETTYRSLFENMLNAFAYFKILFEDGRPVDLLFLQVNMAFEVQSGLKNVTGKKMSEVIPGMGESDPDLIRILARVALTGKPERFEIYVSSLGDWYSVSAYSPQKEYLVMVFDVITERKNAEEQLRRSEAGLRDAQASAHLGNWEINIPAKTLFWSAEMFRIFERNHSLGPPKLNEFVNIVHPDDRERINRNLMQNITEHESYNDEYRIVRADGSVRWIAGQGKAIFDDTGNITQFIGTAQDVTERKQAEEEINKLNEGLEHRINERTAELRESIARFEEVNRTFVGRELKMMELKERIAELEKR